jgi:hypothetical protein
MIEQIRILNKFSWISPLQRKGRIPGPPPMSFKEKTPLYFCARDGGDLFFVNLSKEKLKRVSVEWRGLDPSPFEEGEYIDVGAQTLVYDNVSPGEAVKVDSYDEWCDPECLLFYELTITDISLKTIILKIGKKGGIVDNTVLLWKNGRPGLRVKLIEKID